MDNDGNLNDREGAIAYVIWASKQGGYTGYPQDTKDLYNIFQRYYRMTKNDLIMATSFTYMSNNTFNYYEPDYEQFRVKVETAGNIPQLLSIVRKLPKDDQGQRKFLDVTYAQYAKAELEYIKHIPLTIRKNGGEVFAFRTFIGFAMPYGNGKSIPFPEATLQEVPMTTEGGERTLWVQVLRALPWSSMKPISSLPPMPSTDLL